MPAATAPTYVPVYVAGNSTVHAGRKIGTYASGAPRYARVCGTSRNDRHDPSPAGDAAVTCKRCLAKLPAPAPEVVEDTPVAPAPEAPARDLAFEPRFRGFPTPGDAVILVGLVSGDYRIERVRGAGGTDLWQVEVTTGARARGTVPNLGCVASLDTAIALCARDAGEARDEFVEAHPAVIKRDGVRYVRAGVLSPAGDDVYVALADEEDTPDAITARAFVRATGPDPQEGPTWEFNGEAWRLLGLISAPAEVAYLDAARDDVARQRDEFYAADARMGDPYP